jgi:hypothetical protein
VAEEERSGQIEVQQTLPVIERQLVDRRRGLADDRAATDGVDENVDAPVILHRPLDDALDLAGVERVGDERVCLAATVANGARRVVERGLVRVDEKDRAALATDDLGGRATDAAAAGGDERDPSLESHGGGVYRTRR